MSQKENIKILAIALDEVIASLAEFMILPFFSANNFYSVTQEKILTDRQERRTNLSRKIHDLKRRGYINSFTRGKESFLEITEKGKRRIAKQKIGELKINRPQKWDGKWRVTIFDVSEKHRAARNALRKALAELSFVQIQKSVYVHPFECTEQIQFLCKMLFLDTSVKIMISDIIQGEEDIIAEFIDRGVLAKDDLK